jgi:hypothetical protein
MKKSIVISALILITLQCCTVDKKSSIIGSWKVDSIYTYYNGFDFTRQDVGDEPILHYEADGQLKMTKQEESRSFLFDISIQDTLLHRTLDNKVFDKFFIQKLDRRQLILRKELRPVFKGVQQERYEIKFLSKQ